jgi:transcriptional regulator with XRE-family HTH domain
MKALTMAIGGRPYPKDPERRMRVKVELAKRDMTISDLSKEVGVNRCYLNDLINGTRRSLKNEERIAAFFGMSREALFPPRTIAQLIELRGRAA